MPRYLKILVSVIAVILFLFGLITLLRAAWEVFIDGRNFEWYLEEWILAAVFLILGALAIFIRKKLE